MDVLVAASNDFSDARSRCLSFWECWLSCWFVVLHVQVRGVKYLSGSIARWYRPVNGGLPNAEFSVCSCNYIQIFKSNFSLRAWKLSLTNWQKKERKLSLTKRTTTPRARDENHEMKRPKQMERGWRRVKHTSLKKLCPLRGYAPMGFCWS
jgi:hypothetical protein